VPGTLSLLLAIIGLIVLVGGDRGNRLVGVPAVVFFGAGAVVLLWRGRRACWGGPTEGGGRRGGRPAPGAGGAARGGAKREGGLRPGGSRGSGSIRRPPAGPAAKREKAPEYTVFGGLPPSRYFLARALTISRQKAGRSSGLREVIRLPSTTTSSSTQVAPALA